MDEARVRFVNEIERLRAARKRSRSKYLKSDYGKAIKRMTFELMAYDRYRAEKP